MIESLVHHKWRKVLLNARKDSEVYELMGLIDGTAIPILFVHVNGKWVFRINYSVNTVEIDEVEPALIFLLKLGVEEYELEYER